MKKIFAEVLAKVTPTEKEREKEKKTAEQIMAKIKKAKGKHLGVTLAGSIARNTHLRDDRDIDIFVLFPAKMPRAEFEKEGLAIGRKAFKGHKWWLEYSEHPYTRGIVNGFEIEIVPSYNVKKASQLKSAVDRSPFHNRYLLKHLKPELCAEVRLLKAFLKGIDCYGAKIEKEGFSGYLAELLILKFGSLQKTLVEASNWKPGIALAIGEEVDSKKAKQFNAPLVFLDPTDKNRNVAAALSIEQFARFVAASRAFLEKPDRKFFYPSKPKPISKQRMKKLIGIDQMFALRMPFPKNALSDVIWGQMRKFKKHLHNGFALYGFLPRRVELFAEEGKSMDFFVELESIELNPTIIFTGPPAWDEPHSKAFLAKHSRPLTGPRIENGRWIVEEPRKYVNAMALAKVFLQERKKLEKEPFRKALSKAKFLEKSEFLAIAKKDEFFKYGLSRFLEGKEIFL
ncbi:MAG: CCA tRNA nucleotidyltransferase [Candidatus Diapherotrites archaeon]